MVCNIESPYRNDVARQMEAAMLNILADYEGLFQLRNEITALTKNNDSLRSTLETILDRLANPSLHSKIFAIADALIGGTSVAVSSGDSGGSTSDLP